MYLLCKPRSTSKAYAFAYTEKPYQQSILLWRVQETLCFTHNNCQNMRKIHIVLAYVLEFHAGRLCFFSKNGVHGGGWAIIYMYIYICFFCNAVGFRCFTTCNRPQRIHQLCNKQLRDDLRVHTCVSWCLLYTKMCIPNMCIYLICIPKMCILEMFTQNLHEMNICTWYLLICKVESKMRTTKCEY